MSENNKQKKVEQMRQQSASAYDRELDPLAKFADGLYENEIDPFFMFEVEVLDTKDITQNTRELYDVALRQWKEFMEDEIGRHPACPSERHVRDFIDYCQSELDNSDEVISKKLRKINRAYEYWQTDVGLPHPDTYNPIKEARKKVEIRSENEKKPVPRISEQEMRERISDITHTTERAYIGIQLKLGLRVGELRNIKLSHVNLQQQDVNNYYDELGTHRGVRDRPNAIYIPSNDEMEGNKSVNSRVLPLDDELRQVLVRYLMIRPTVDLPWLFLSDNASGQVQTEMVNEAWKDAFYPEYEFGEDDRFRSITSHYGRHYFSNYWETELASRGHPVKYIMYMRGDKIKAEEGTNHSVDQYLQTYYEDVRDLYVDGTYRLGLKR